MNASQPPPAAAAGTLSIGGDLTVNRMGFGAMRITGPGVWGPPRDRAEAIRVLRRLPELGINFVDTADSYGPYVSEELIREALHPYPEGLIIASKAGFERQGPGKWSVNCRPEHLRRSCEGSLGRLKVDRIDLFQLHRIDPEVPLEDQFGTLGDLQREGKIRHIGLSEVSPDQIREAGRHVRIVSVQNQYSLLERRWEASLEHCEREGIPFLPWAPLAAGPLTTGSIFPQRLGRDVGASPTQLALAWLLHRSPVMLLIPGTSSLKHLEENTAAAHLALDAEIMAGMEKAANAYRRRSGPSLLRRGIRKLRSVARGILR